MSTTVSVVVPLLPAPSMTPIVVVPLPTAVASPDASIVATAVSLLLHVRPVPLILTAIGELTTVPFPSWPASFNPHERMVLSASNAALCQPPTAAELTPLTPATCTGADQLEADPSPTSPKSFSPQHRSV